MKARLIAMTGAVFLIWAAPAMAGEPTPAEQEATRQLNLQASENAKPDMPQNGAVTATPNGILSSIINPPSKVATANVLNAYGKTVGVVQKVEVTPEGKPTTVSVAILGSKEVVVLDASSVNYDAHKNEITASSGLPSNG